MMLYFLMSLRSSSSRMRCAVSSFMITAPVIHLIFSAVLDVAWGHVSSFTGISRERSEHSATAAPTSVRRRRVVVVGGGFFFFISRITPAMPTVPSEPLDTPRHFWAAHPATMVTEEFY